jgi:hypothetical protein
MASFIGKPAVKDKDKGQTSRQGQRTKDKDKPADKPGQQGQTRTTRTNQPSTKTVLHCVLNKMKHPLMSQHLPEKPTLFPSTAMNAA